MNTNSSDQVKTLNDYIERLKPVQQEYIVHCVREHGDRPDFHRGLLPFLNVEEAARCLKFKLEEIKANGTLIKIRADNIEVTGERFIRGIISVFQNSLRVRLHQDEEYQIIHLNTVKLKRGFKGRFSKKFCVRLTDYYSQTGLTSTDGLFELQMVSRNTWRITGHKQWLNTITDFLCDCYR